MALTHYEAVKEGRIPPLYRTAREAVVSAKALSLLPEEELWRLHDKTYPRPPLSCPAARRTSTACRARTRPRVSLLDVKVELARRNLKSCTLCECNCHVNRLAGEAGVCGLGDDLRLFREDFNYAEELPLVPTQQFWFTACNFRCPYCSVLPHARDAELGDLIGTEDFQEHVYAAQRRGAACLSFLGGDPTVNLYGILKLLQSLETHLPLCWNTNMYASETAMRLLEGVVDVFIADCRAGNETCAQQLGSFANLMDVTLRNVRLALRQASVILRHLVLPGHLDCCLLPIAQTAARELPEVDFHLMLNYTPYYLARDDNTLNRPLTVAERGKAQDIAHDYHLTLIE